MAKWKPNENANRGRRAVSRADGTPYVFRPLRPGDRVSRPPCLGKSYDWVGAVEAVDRESGKARIFVNGRVGALWLLINGLNRVGTAPSVDVEEVHIG